MKAKLILDNCNTSYERLSVEVDIPFKPIKGDVIHMSKEMEKNLTEGLMSLSKDKPEDVMIFFSEYLKGHLSKYKRNSMPNNPIERELLQKMFQRDIKEYKNCISFSDTVYVTYTRYSFTDNLLEIWLYHNEKGALGCQSPENTDI